MFCSELSLSAGEPLFATASQTEVFFLLEYNGPWEDKAFEKSTIPEAVKQHLKDATKSLPAAKVLLIKRSSASPTTVTNFFIVKASERSPKLYHFILDSYENLLSLDITAALNDDAILGDAILGGKLIPSPIFLVCTNGRRDLCCAKFGFAVYEALRDIAGNEVWECSHVGGHRFAPNVYQMPYGMLYGRVQPEHALALFDAARAGNLILDHLRGRSVYPEAAQAAEYYLRRQTGELGLEAYRLAESGEHSPGLHQVRFLSNTDGAEYTLTVALEQGGTQVYESCSLDKSTPIKSFSLA